MTFVSYSLVMCIGTMPLLERVRRAAAALSTHLEQINPDDIEQHLTLQPGCRILVCQEDAQFEHIVRQCEHLHIATQSALVRLVDGSDYASCVATANVCQALNIPSSDSRLIEILKQLLGVSMSRPVDEVEQVEATTLRALTPADAEKVSADNSPAITLPHSPQQVPAIADINDEIYETARRIAGTDVDIVLLGETGTGKDWLAHYIHDHSGARGPFVAVNCPAIPETLAEAELFGVDAGAYTGATKSRAGRIESAHGGTLYLDEIDSMPLMLQAKLLRVLQDRGVERVGSTVFRQLSFRVIVSTKVPLSKLVEEGKFRSDLYYRLSVVELALPVLRAHPSRALDLFWRYARQAESQFKLAANSAVNPSIEAEVLAHKWEGNIRELRAAAQRYALGFRAIQGPPNEIQGGTLKEMMHHYERALLIATLERCKRNVSRAAKELGVEPHVLYYKLKTLGVHIVPRSENEAASPSPARPMLSTVRSVERKGKAGAVN